MTDWDALTKPGKPGGRPCAPSEIFYCGDVSLVICKAGTVLIDTADASIVDGINWQITTGGYAVWRRREGGRVPVYMMHRLLLKAPPGFDVDHINGNRLDNRRENIRICTRAENMANIPSRSSTGMAGAYERDGRYQAKICIAGERIALGTFATAEEAHGTYRAARSIDDRFYSRSPPNK